MIFWKKWGILIKKESGSLEFTGLEIPRDYFQIWEGKLLSEIYANLTEYNPELKSLAEIIRIETENIAELENNQKLIQSSLDTIIDLMSWKVAEGE